MKAVVTGHSRGLGAAITAQLLSRNVQVLGISRNRNAELEARFPYTLEQHELDLSDSFAVAQWLAGDTLQRFLFGCHMALLVNNAAMVQPIGPIGVQDPIAIARTVGVNVAAPIMFSAAMVRLSSEAMDRRIMHVSSGAGRMPLPGLSVYCATKAALDHHARAGNEDKVSRLRICSIAPGVVDTDMQAGIRAAPLELFPLRPQMEAMKLNGALLSPEECAQNLVDYFLCDRFGETPIMDLMGNG